MSKTDVLTIDQKRLAEAWQQTLPTVLNKSDQAEVTADEHDPKSVRIHIRTAGHSMYTFDFQVTYMDSREVKVDLVDVERADQTVDERNETIQQLVEDYVRHIHECAQALKRITS
ncbi:hypothetical protein [Paenibacillus flagellatus]|uniref:Uncharacterized protein n=1 Tax=Paenibacillus flagellatus TaxID=2211139 RepID=A0A2V5JWD7_9BACL|nr:hypothetical protein [Paenibacillus flagellatus]PYI51105.1 hypothetical protein DLM86_25765 [Paenibacillus flagellatus]